MARQWTCEKALMGSALVRNQLARDSLSGEVYIFLNRQRNLIKLLHWENSGLVQYYKRLEKGTFQALDNLTQGGTLAWLELVLMDEAIRIKRSKQFPRYQHKAEQEAQ